MSRKNHSRGGRAGQARTVGNPVARSPLMRKGGVHERSASGQRVRARLSTRAALEDWLDERETDDAVVYENGELRLPVLFPAYRKPVWFSRWQPLPA